MIERIFYSRLIGKFYFFFFFFFLKSIFSHVLFLEANHKEMKFKAVCLGHSRFVVNKKEKKKQNDKITLRKFKVQLFFLFLHMLWPCGGTSNEYPQQMFYGKIRKKYHLDNPLIDMEQ